MTTATYTPSFTGTTDVTVRSSIEDVDLTAAAVFQMTARRREGLGLSAHLALLTELLTEQAAADGVVLTSLPRVAIAALEADPEPGFSDELWLVEADRSG